MDNCTIDCIQEIGNFDFHKTCQFVQKSCQQDSVQFIQGYYCIIHQSFILLALFGSILFILLYLALNALTEHSLTPSVENLISRFKISPTLAGVTFLAFANGAPDVLTAILAGSSSSSSTALIPFGSIFGAALFSTAFILSSVIFASPNQRVKVKMQQILVPLGFYIFGIVYLMIISITYQKMNVYIAAVLLVCYAIFIIFILKNEKKRRKQHKESQKIIINSSNLGSVITSEKQLTQEQQPEEDIKTITKSELEEAQKDLEQLEESNFLFSSITKIQRFFEYIFKWLIPPRSNDQWQPTKSLISLLISPFVIALSQDMRACFQNMILGVPLIIYLSIPALLLILHTCICILKGWKPIQPAFYTIYSFIVTIAWITVACGVLINLLELVQLLTDVNSVFLGLTFLAWANSIGDYLSILTFAKRGLAATAVAGVFSGQLFNFLFGFGASLMVQSVDGEYEFDIFAFKGSNFEIVSDSIVVLVICAGLVFFSLVYYKVISKRGLFEYKEGVFYRSYYFIILGLAIAIAVLTDFLREISCDIQL